MVNLVPEAILELQETKDRWVHQDLQDSKGLQDQLVLQDS